MTASEVLEYEDEILDLIQKERLPDEGERGLAVYLDDHLGEKIYSINPTVEEWNSELYISFWDFGDRFELEQEIMNLRCAYDEDDFA